MDLVSDHPLYEWQGFPYAAQASLELMVILLPQPPKCWIIRMCHKRTYFSFPRNFRGVSLDARVWVCLRACSPAGNCALVHL